ncbi:helix-turn-helix domain-containing protein [Leifsonia sp. NCR5]|uniref:helix-turn-helix domain-containing protein n=1 Tax=Leifsonia sp. NCR5 TaxID=1978342 RepID=UPI0015C46233|nr:AraC family transcriptional regulator [Leifsonia sp. NCR5]
MSETFHDSTVTRDVDTAEAKLQATYASIVLGTDPHTNGLRYAEEVHGENRFVVARHLFDGDVECAAELPFFTVASVVGSYLWRTGGEEGDLSQGPAIFQPGRRLDASVSHADVSAVSITVESLAATAAAQFGDGVTMRFDSALPVTRALGEHWLAVARLARQTALTEAFENDLVRASIYRQLAIATIEAFPLTGDHQARRTTVASRAVAFKRAVSYIDDHASLPITVDDIATAAGTTVPELDRAFDMHLPYTADQYLHSVRLSAAHRDLREGKTDVHGGVAAVAARWGFVDVDAFEAHYRFRFGTSPEQTLGC